MGITHDGNFAQQIREIDEWLDGINDMRRARRVVLISDFALHGAAAKLLVDGTPRMVYAMPTTDYSNARGPRDLRPAVGEPEAEDAYSSSPQRTDPNVLGLDFAE